MTAPINLVVDYLIFLYIYVPFRISLINTSGQNKMSNAFDSEIKLSEFPNDMQHKCLFYNFLWGL